MDVRRAVLAVAVVCLGFAGPAAHAQSDGELAAARAKGPAKPWKNVRGFGRVLNLTTLPLVIDEPGLYAIDRNWQIPRAAADANPELIRITADDVTLDLHGFEISADISAPPGSTLLVITGHRVGVRDGELAACCDGAVAMYSTGSALRLHRVAIFSHETMTFAGNGAELTDSQLGVRVTLQVAGRSTLERNTIVCNRGSRCVRLLGDGNRMTDNSLSLAQGGGIDLVGNANVVANNVVDASNAPDSFEALEVRGDSNVVRGNTVLIQALNGHPAFVISGTANTLEGNIAAPPRPGIRTSTGMQLTADGNYYGNNRMAAQVPFSLGGTVQTDWGGNVGY